jgi:nucleotide-binding universal stress UspA family protein
MTGMFDSVIVGVGSLESGRDAVELAKALVSSHGDLALVYVEPVADESAPQPRTGSDAERQRFGLERLVRLRDAADIAADVLRIQAGSVGRGLHECAAGRSADLIVIGASRGKHLEHVLLGGEAREVLDDPPCAVAVAPAGYSAHSDGIRNIGVGYDGSPEGERALAVARAIAAERDATVSTFEAVRVPVHAHAPPNLRGQTDDTVAALRRYGASVDLLILGSYRQRRPDRHPDRSKSQRLAEDLSSPLLVLGSAGSASG